MTETLKLILSHKGAIDQKIVNRLLFEIKELLLNAQIDRTTLKKTYNIAVESLENGIKHSPDSSINFSLFLNGLSTIIETENLINNEEVKDLKDLLERANQLNKEELLELYIEKLRTTAISSRGGAGLGMLDIAIKAKNPIQFSFETKNDLQSVFKLKIVIN